jgi:hypothetical protein
MENPINQTTEESKELYYKQGNGHNKSKFGSSKKMVRPFDSDLQIKSEEMLYEEELKKFQNAEIERKQDSLMKSIAEHDFVSPKSGSDSVSVPFNFTSDNEGYERSSGVNFRPNRLRMAGASILSGSQSNGFDKKTTVRIRGKQTEMTEGMIGRTLEEQKKYEGKQKEIRRANERLKTLEKLEKYRQQKVKDEIEKMEEERRQEELNRENKRRENMKKRRRIAQQKREIEASKQEREREKSREIMEKLEIERMQRENKDNYFKKQKDKISSYRERQKLLENDLKEENLMGYVTSQAQ